MGIGIWLGFSTFIVIALALDTVGFGKIGRPHESMRAALTWTIIWVSCALIFNGMLWLYLYSEVNLNLANQKSLEFFTGYLIEKSLSVDNLFVFYMVFHHFRIPLAYQHRILAYGIWGAVMMRLGVILIGTWLVSQFHWVLYVMGIFLILTGIKICVTKEKEKDITETMFIRMVKRFMRVTAEIQSNHFFIRKHHVLYATPLFLALLFIEFSDLIFAMDSIPAIFAITTDPFIVWTSNVFAILGLRAMYFLLAGMVERFRLLKYGIALILIFVGFKMVIEPWLDISIGISLAVIVSILFSFGWLSIYAKTTVK